MHIDFEKTFNNSHLPRLSMPQKVLDYLGKDLPKDTKYQMDNSGNVCIVGKDNTSISISGLKVDITDKMRQQLGDNPSAEEIVNYSYNTQSVLSFSLIKPGFVTINGSEVPLNKFAWNIYEQVSISNGKFYAHPNPFPDFVPCVFTSKDGKHRITLMIKRVRNESAFVEKYVTEDNKPIKLEFYLDKDCGSHKASADNNKVSIKLFLKKAKSLSEQVDILIITRDNFKNSNVVNESLVSWYEKALAIERFLGITFLTKNIELSNDNLNSIETLYEALVLQNAVRVNSYVNSIDYSQDMNESIVNELKKNNGKYAFQYTKTRVYYLFGEEIELFALVASFNLFFHSVEKMNNGGFRLLFDKGSGNEQAYSSILLFKSAEEYTDFVKKSDNSKLINTLASAKTIFEYNK